MPDEHSPAGAARARCSAAAQAERRAHRRDVGRSAATRHGGPFLFGKFCAADAMYAPVVTRLDTYGIKVSRETLGYMETVMALPAFAEWRAGALAEPWIVAEDEIDWPTVL